jgi:hypothetical protein
MRYDNWRYAATALAGVVVALVSACQLRSAGESEKADTAAVRTDSVLLRTQKAEYRAGEALTLTVENRSGTSFAFNPCMRTVERDEGGTWTPVPESDRMCTMEAWILEPRQTRTASTELPTALSPGRYRIVVRMTTEQPSAPATVVAVSDPIRVN